jgi:hypothetical protein
VPQYGMTRSSDRRPWICTGFKLALAICFYRMIRLRYSAACAADAFLPHPVLTLKLIDATYQKAHNKSALR